jgi:hypothetical protein
VLFDIESAPCRARGTRVASVSNTDHCGAADLVDGVACGFVVLWRSVGNSMPHKTNEESAL